MIYFIKSSRKREVKTQITIIASNVLDALKLASRYFERKGIKGKPVLAV